MADTQRTRGPAPGRRTPERRIAVGLALSLGLAVASGAASVWRSVEGRQTVVELSARESEFARNLSEIGRDVARLRAAALEEARTGTPPRGVTAPRLRLMTLTRAFDERLRNLDPLLASRGHDLGEGLRGVLETFRQALERFETAAAVGDVVARDKALDELVVVTSRLQSTLDAVLEESRAGTLVSLTRIDNEFGRLTSVEILLSLLLIVGLSAVWISALRASRVSSRLLADHVARTEQANKDLDAFAGRVAHDFRNVLGPLPLLSRRLRGGKVTDLEAAADQLERVAQRGDALITGLLAFSRLGTVEDDLAAPLRAAVEDVLEELQPLVTSSGARIDLDVDDSAVACAPALLHMVLANLISNALKYLGDAPRRVVTVKSRASPGGVCLLVKDTGPGIPEEHMPHLFEPFFRVPGTQVQGTGLGLPTVRRIVEATGGRVTLRSVPGKGTTVSLRLPLARRAAASAFAPGTSALPDGRPPLTH